MSTEIKNLKREVPWSGVGAIYTDAEIALITEIMRNTRDTFTQGKYQQEFESEFCRYGGNEFAFAVSSCTAALELAALLARLGPGDEVIMPAHTFCATAIPFARTGARIVWADIDPETWVVTNKTLEAKITSKTKCIVVVHLYGLAADMQPIIELARRHDILVVEDCAQALGAESGGKKVGSWGDFGCFSFHTHKNITTLGEGGILTLQDSELAKLVPGLRHNGCRAYPEPREKYWVPAMGNVDFDLDRVWPYNFCIGEPQCALGAMLLKRIDALIEKRVARASQFIEAVKGYPELIFQKVPKGQISSRHLLPARYDGKITGKSNNDFIEIMYKEYNIKIIVQYYPLYRYPLFQKSGFGEADCPATDYFYDNMVSFPFHSWMPDEEFYYMLESAVKTLKKLRNREAVCDPA
ncbi:DegT/DnrJ/EryC1/StrS family aminotransferase [Candidatus Omnitrophota bacterium]